MPSAPSRPHAPLIRTPSSPRISSASKTRSNCTAPSLRHPDRTSPTTPPPPPPSSRPPMRTAVPQRYLSVPCRVPPLPPRRTPPSRSPPRTSQDSPQRSKNSARPFPIPGSPTIPCASAYTACSPLAKRPSTSARKPVSTPSGSRHLFLVLLPSSPPPGTTSTRARPGSQTWSTTLTRLPYKTSASDDYPSFSS
jgi:hypothetical protein